MLRNFISIFILIACFTISSETLAQDGPKWVKECVNPKKPVTCRIVQSLYLNKIVDGVAKPLGRILELTVLYSALAEAKTRKPYLNFKVPLGVNLQSGMVFKIDDRKEVQLGYLTCTNEGCGTSLPIDSALLRTLKAGSKLTVGWIPWGESKISVVPSTLVGFSNLFKGIKQ